MHRSPRTPFEMQEFRREDSALKAKAFSVQKIGSK
jgi:hypothetical protein